MTDPTIALKQYLINIGLEKDADFLRQAVQLLTQMLMEFEVEQQVGAGKHERTPDRKNYRNGHRQRTWRPELVKLTWRSPNCARAAISPVCWNHVGQPRKPCLL